MGALVFHALLSMALLAVTHWVAFRLLPTWKPSHEALAKHGLAVLLSVFFSYLFYLHSAFGMRPSPFEHGHKASLAYPFAHSEEARTALLGYLIALAGYYWYWDRRRTFERADAAIAAMNKGGLRESADTLVALRKLADRMDPPTLMLFLVLAFSVAAVEFPGILKAFDTTIGKDGSISLSVRDPVAAEQNKFAFDSGGSSGTKSLVDDFLVLGTLAGRIQKDVESICALATWKAASMQLLQRPLQSRFQEQSHFIAQMPVSKECVTPGPTADQIPNELFQMLSPIRDYKSIAENRTYALVECLAGVAQHPARGPVVRVLATKIFETRLRLEAALLEWSSAHPASSARERLIAADAEVRSYFKTIADLAALENPVGLPVGWIALGTPCNTADNFARQLGVDIKNAPVTPYCADKNPQMPSEIKFSCEILLMDDNIPYERLAMAAFSYIAGQSRYAILHLERWLAARKKPDQRSALDDWFSFIGTNLRNLMVRRLFGDLERSSYELLEAMHENASAGFLLEKYARNFEQLASGKDSATEAMCGSDSFRRLAVILTIRNEESHLKLHTAVSQGRSGQSPNDFKPHKMELAYNDAIKWRDTVKCMRDAKLYSTETSEYLEIALAETEANYWNGLAAYLESPTGRAAAFSSDSDAPKKLRSKAAASLDLQISKLESLKTFCKRPDQTNQVCRFTINPYASSPEKVRRYLAGGDDFFVREKRMSDLLYDLTARKQ